MPMTVMKAAGVKHEKLTTVRLIGTGNNKSDRLPMMVLVAVCKRDNTDGKDSSHRWSLAPDEVQCLACSYVNQKLGACLPVCEKHPAT